MYERTTIITNPSGLHARPGSLFVAKAEKFSTAITLSKLDKKGAVIKQCSAKSIVQLLTMALTQNTRITLSADGEDAKYAVDSLIKLIESGFDEI